MCKEEIEESAGYLMSLIDTPSIRIYENIFFMKIILKE